MFVYFDNTDYFINRYCKSVGAIYYCVIAVLNPHSWIQVKLFIMVIICHNITSDTNSSSSSSSNHNSSLAIGSWNSIPLLLLLKDAVATAAVVTVAMVLSWETTTFTSWHCQCFCPSSRALLTERNNGVSCHSCHCSNRALLQTVHFKVVSGERLPVIVRLLWPACWLQTDIPAHSLN